MRRKGVLAWLLLLPLVALGLARLQFDADVLHLLPDSVPVVRGLKVYQARFANSRELLITLEGSDAAGVDQAAARLAATLRAQTNLVAQVVWQPPWLESPAQASELLAYLWLNQPPDVFGRMLERFDGAALTNALRAAQSRLATSFNPSELARLSYDPLQLTQLPLRPGEGPLGTGEDLFASADGLFRVVHVEARPALPGYRECHAWLEAVKKSVGALNLAQSESGPVRAQYTGRPAFLSEISMGMERDILVSAGSTFAIIALLFYAAHRAWKPLCWLAVLLVMILSGTTALGGLAFGLLNVVSLGFAAILLGLSVDYGLVLYQEARAHPAMDPHAVRRAVAPGIAWSAATTAAAFAVLNLSSLPGLRQFGTLVAVGVLLAALIMLTLYLRPLLRPQDVQAAQTQDSNSAPARPRPPRLRQSIRRGITVALVAGAIACGLVAPPRFDHSADALRPRHSPAYETVQRIKTRLGPTEDPLWLVITSSDLESMRERLARAESALSDMVDGGMIESFALPTRLWPHPERQRRNAELANQKRAWLESAESVILGQGFSDGALGVVRSMADGWQAAASGPGVYWPTNEASRWVLSQLISLTEGSPAVVGLIHPGSPRAEAAARALAEKLPDEEMVVSGWSLLGPSLFSVVKRELAMMLVPMVVVMGICLGLAFRQVKDVLMSLATLAVSASVLFLVMHVMEWSWNLINLMALPLLVGAGLDYSIHVQLAMRRHRQDAERMRRTIGRALLLCAATSACGFGSLGLSSNAGLASLGTVCAVGLMACYASAVHLLPAWMERGKASDG